LISAPTVDGCLAQDMHKPRCHHVKAAGLRNLHCGARHHFVRDHQADAAESPIQETP
jgi:hypothetical protein